MTRIWDLLPGFTAWGDNAGPFNFFFLMVIALVLEKPFEINLGFKRQLKIEIVRRIEEKIK